MSNTPGTLTLTLRFNKKKDADILFFLACSENYTQTMRDAIRYFMKHEQEAYKELYPSQIYRDAAYCSGALNRLLK